VAETHPAVPPAARGPAGSAGRLRAERREALLDAADDALRSEGSEVSMDSVAARAGVTKPILYRHFGDRHGLMVAVTRRHADRLVTRLREALHGQASPRQRLRVTIDTYLAFLERDPDLHRAAVGLGALASGPQGVIDEAQELVCAEVAADIHRELAPAGIDEATADTFGAAIVGMVRMVGTRWLEELEQRQTTRQELTDRLTDLLWQGLRGVVPAPTSE
jgi:AcrR family transcriptional regulator